MRLRDIRARTNNNGNAWRKGMILSREIRSDIRNNDNAHQTKWGGV